MLLSEEFEHGGDDLFDLRTEKPDTDSQEIRAKYRLVLLDGIGLDVLSDILRSCHFGCTLNPENTVQVAEYNVGIAILGRCGIFGEGTFEQVVKALASVTPKM